MHIWISSNFILTVYLIIYFTLLPEQQADNQPTDNQTDDIAYGPGGGGMQPRSSEAKKQLPKLTRDMEELLAKAKRFAMEQSVKHVLAKQAKVQLQVGKLK